MQLAGQATRSANPHRDRTPADEQAANAQIAAEFAADPSTSMHDASFWQAVIEDFRSAVRSRDSRSEYHASSTGRPSVAEQALLPAAEATEQATGQTADHQPDRPAESAREADPNSPRAAQPAERRSELLTERFAAERLEHSAAQLARSGLRNRWRHRNARQGSHGAEP